MATLKEMRAEKALKSEELLRFLILLRICLNFHQIKKRKSKKEMMN